MEEKLSLTVQAPVWDADTAARALQAIERRLRASEQRFRLMIDSSPVAMVMTDAAGRIDLVNTRTEQLFGYTHQELIGQTIEVLVPERFRGCHPDFRSGFMRDPQARPMGAGRDLYGRRKDGSECPIEIGLSPLAMPEATFVLATIVDITERKRAEETRAHLAALVESSSDAIVSKTLQGVVTSWNAGAERLFGYLAEEMVGAPITRIIPPERLSEEDLFLTRLSRGERIEHYETERLRKGGRRVPVSLTVSPIRGPGGRIIGASKIARDITERKRAEEHRELLVRELNHRGKNTLSIVQSIASQTLRQAHSLDDFGRTFSGRVRALAATHDLLQSSDGWVDVDLRELLERTLSPIVPRERVDLEGEPVSLPATAAVNFGMIFHELATNASKYGAFAAPRGRVQVSWSLGGYDDAERPLVIEWCESGGPPAVAPSSEARGFGSRLIESLARALEASTEREWSTAGLRFRLTVSLGS